MPKAEKKVRYRCEVCGTEVLVNSVGDWTLEPIYCCEMKVEESAVPSTQRRQTGRKLTAGSRAGTKRGGKKNVATKKTAAKKKTVAKKKAAAKKKPAAKKKAAAKKKPAAKKKAAAKKKPAAKKKTAAKK